MIGLVIRRLDPAEAAARVSDLAEVLVDCVEGGASVSFMAPLSTDKAERFWRGVADRVAEGTTDVLVAERDGAILGTVQLVAAQPENQPHRADIAKMLVHRAARRKGIARALVTAAEAVALDRGKTVLVLDTVSGSAADNLYRSLGWVEVGRVPDYALYPDGRFCDTTVFFKRLGPLRSGR